MADDQSTLVKAVIAVLHDGEKGFPDIGEHLKDTSKKSFFLQEAQTRGEFARELEQAYSSATGESIDVGGTGIGAIHRVWGDLKAKLSSGDHTLLETAEQGEDTAKQAYKDALEQELPLPIHQLISEQQAHVLTSHDYVKRARDERKS